MIARTICISQPAYLSLAKGQLVIRLPEVEKADIPEGMKERWTKAQKSKVLQQCGEITTISE